ncbi:MAG: hypothetical protein ACJ8C4_08580 [Gemmataceae bacterium]
MTVGDLREALAQLDASKNANVMLHGFCVPIMNVTNPEGAEFVVIRGKNTGAWNEKFTTNEDGLIGHLLNRGFDSQRIGEVLGRTKAAVAKRRKKLGF